MTTNLHRASRQWAERPNDERFWNVPELQAHCQQLRAASAEKTLELRQLKCQPTGQDIAIVGPQGVPVAPTNWGFSQLCRMAGAPADYLTGLPSQLACDCLNHGLTSNTERVKLLLQRTGDVTELRAVTTPKYTRFWDSELCQLLRPAIDAGWKTPPARPSRDDDRARPATDADVIAGMEGGVQVRAGDMIAPAGVYRGDRDSFILLMNPDKPIDDGNGGGGLFKGIIASNSEVGKASIRFQAFSFQGVCGNHIIWGAENVCEYKRVHRGNIRKFVTELQTWLRRYADSDVFATEAMIRKAKQFALGADKVEVSKAVHKLGYTGLTLKAIEGAWNMAERWENTAGATPNTAWGFVHGLTRYSQTLGFQDLRQQLDVAGGKILALAN